MVIAVLALILAAVIGYLVWSNMEVPPPVEPLPTDDELMQARLDIYRVSRGVDAALAGQEAHREAERTKQAIADALDDRP